MGLNFFNIDADYCNYLQKFDANVSYQQHFSKEKRQPPVGIVLQVGLFAYYVPLTSPKPKHFGMKNEMDFLKIANGFWGAINFNNMIPVHFNSISRIEIKNMPVETKAERDYRNLVINQRNWCNKNKYTILVKATKLYNYVLAKKCPQSIIERCCDFLLDEQKYMAYASMHNWNIQFQSSPSMLDEMGQNNDYDLEL